MTEISDFLVKLFDLGLFESVGWEEEEFLDYLYLIFVSLFIFIIIFLIFFLRRLDSTCICKQIQTNNLESKSNSDAIFSPLAMDIKRLLSSGKSYQII